MCTILFFFFNDTATTEIYTLSLHDALPISRSVILWTARPLMSSPSSRILPEDGASMPVIRLKVVVLPEPLGPISATMRSEEHTSELQSHLNLVCRLLLEKKKH